MSHAHRRQIRRHRDAIARGGLNPIPNGVPLVRVTYRSGKGMPGGTIHLLGGPGSKLTLPVAPMRGQRVVIVAGLIALARMRMPWLDYLRARRA